MELHTDGRPNSERYRTNPSSVCHPEEERERERERKKKKQKMMKEERAHTKYKTTNYFS